MGVIGERKEPRSSCGAIIPVRSYSEPADDVAQTPPPVLSGWREPDVGHIERHGIMDTAEYTFTVGRVYLFSSDMPSCPAELALWGCFAYRAAGRPVLEAATRNGWDYLCLLPLPDAYRFCRPASRREHVWFMRCYAAALERCRFPNTFPSDFCLTGNRLYLTDDSAGTELPAGDAGAFSQPPPRAL